MPEPRSVPFQVRLTPTEQEELFALAELDGLSASDVVRQFVRNEYRRRIATARAAEESGR